MMNPTFPVSTSTANLALHNALDAWQAWSDTTFDSKYREAILTLVEGLAQLAVYLAGTAYYWLNLQVVRTVRYWLSAAEQAVPVLNGWWKAPFVKIQAVSYPESCWREIAPAVAADILDYELSWAGDAEPLR